MPSHIDTAVARTVGAVMTGTAALVASTETLTLTPPPTSNSTILPTVTVTPFLGAASGDLECKLLSQSLRNGAHFDPREDFNMGWKVRNTGGITWEPGSVSFAYYSGTKMDRDDLYALPESVQSGATAALSASLVAPKRAGTYTTVWALRRGENRFCQVSLTINVP